MRQCASQICYRRGLCSSSDSIPFRCQFPRDIPAQSPPRRFKSSRSTVEPRQDGPQPLAQLLPERRGEAIETEQQRLRTRNTAARYAAHPYNFTATSRLRQDGRTSIEAGTPRGNPLGKSVIIVNAVSRTLTSHDFTRLSPKATALGVWDLGRGRITKVVPGRDLETLERQEHYFLIFDSVESAWEYKDRVIKISKMSSQHHSSFNTTREAAESQPQVPQEHLLGLTRSYALTSPEENLDLRVLHAPFSRGIKAFVERAGYPYLVDRSDKMPGAVVIRTEFAKLSVGGLKRLFYKAEKARNMPWTQPNYDSITITAWKAPGPAQNPNLLKEAALDFHAPSRSLKRGDIDADVAIEFDPRYSSLLAAGTGDGAQNRSEEGQQPHREHPKRTDVARTFIVGFQAEHEAETFARYWHRRTLPLANTSLNEPAIELSAEVLW